MSRPVSILVVMLALGCGGADESVSPAQDMVVAVDGALLAGSWPVRMAEDARRAPFENHAGWRHVFERDYPEAVQAFASSKDTRGLARMHQALSDVYRQGALLAANATIEAYGADGQDTDPVEVAYVLGVSAALRGDKKAAGEYFSQLPSGTQFAPRASAWTTLLDQEPRPSLAQLENIVGSLGEIIPGTFPQAPSIPHFQFPERSAKARLMDVNDPTELLARATWHSDAARAAGSEADTIVLDLLDHRYALQKEASADVESFSVDDAWLFCGSALSAEDVPFIAEASVEGVAAVQAWSTRSVLAAAIQPALVDGKIDPQAVLDASLAMQKQLQRHMADVGGQEADFHRPFAQLARIAVLQAGMIAADANGQYRDAGILRLEALDRMEPVGIDPVFAISVAAWDAGNRNPMRPEDLLHTFSDSFPALAAARSPLEALHLRRSRTAAPTSPVH